ncbi:hypothetical protein O3M35_007217 [Rhynocoris fuscipes]|uniref:Cytochrome P450 n=1 Tax=Rhynocoris fuscipes TaxID=488301 RepID=A0AAW1DB80_9HEMI
MLLILLGILVTCIILLWIYSSPFYWKRKGVPYLFPLPIFGSNLPSLYMSNPDFFDYLYNCFPNEKYFGFHFFMKPTLVVKDPTLMKEICIRDFEYFTWNAQYANENDPFSQNLFFLHGQAWKDIRLKLTPLYTPSKLRVINEYVDNCMIKVNKSINEKIQSNESIHFDKLTIAIATDVIVQSVFGIESDCFEKNSRFIDISNQMFSDSSNTKILLSMISPELNDFFKLNIFSNEVNNFIKNILEDVIKHRESNPTNNQDFLNLMITMMKNRKPNDEKYYPDKSIVPGNDFQTALAQALILFAGGAESSAMTMAFFLYEAALNQEIQDKCRDEIMAIVNETGTDIRPEDVNKLTYLDMAIKETMRKYPPFILMTRKCTKSYLLKDTNTVIEPGTLVVSFVKSLQWDPKHYPDPEQFIPERFADKSLIDPGTYLPWGLGPRTCIGKNFAKMEMILVMSRLLRKYRFTLSPKTAVPINFSPTAAVLKPDPGIYLDAQPIN